MSKIQQLIEKYESYIAENTKTAGILKSGEQYRIECQVIACHKAFVEDLKWLQKEENNEKEFVKSLLGNGLNKEN